MENIAVFCGSAPGKEDYLESSAYELGIKLAEKGIGLVYGGSKNGLMGAVADGALGRKGKVIGVLPVFLQEKEIAHEQLSELILVESMSERKMKIYGLCDGFITLPGGYGTLDELFEMLTWAQLGMHSKPIGVLNVNGYYDALIVLLDTMVRNALLKQENRDMILFEEDMEVLIERMENYKAPEVVKWINKKIV